MPSHAARQGDGEAARAHARARRSSRRTPCRSSCPCPRKARPWKWKRQRQGEGQREHGRGDAGDRERAHHAAAKEPAASDEPVAPAADRTASRGARSTNGTRAPTRDLRTWWAGARKRIGAADTSVYLALNRLQAGALVDRTLVFASRILDWGEVWALVTLLAAWRDPRHLERLPFLVLPPPAGSRCSRSTSRSSRCSSAGDRSWCTSARG